MTDEFIERRIVAGFIVSTDYVRRVHGMFEASGGRVMASGTARTLINWCLEHFRRYGSAPGRNIEGIFAQKLKEGLPRDRAEWIEEVLEDLSDEHDREQFNVPYLVDQTRAHFNERALRAHADEIRGELDAGNLVEAERLAVGYTSVAGEGDQSSVYLFERESREVVERAFAQREAPLLRFPKALGEFWNHEFVREGFISLMGPEKRGKTFMLIEVAVRALKGGCNVAFFQAGDMTEAQQAVRFGVYLNERSDKQRYCNGLWVPVADCVHNQLDTCDEQVRECDHGVFDSEEQVRRPKYEDLVRAVKDNPDYATCTNCQQYRRHTREGMGAVWLKWREPCAPITWKDAYKAFRRFERRRRPARFKLSTHSNESLSVSEVRGLLEIWEREERFVPDVIIIDYADLLAACPDISRLEYRHQVNKVWQRLRRLSQDRRCLVVTATQTDAASYGKELLGMMHFSEDKRKYAHVTAMYGLNQTDEEKRIGIMRLNEIVVRESDFDVKRTVKVLQRLQMGRPVVGSYR